MDLKLCSYFQKFSANSGYLDRAVRPRRGAGMSSAVAPPTCGSPQRQTPALPGQPAPAHQPTRPRSVLGARSSHRHSYKQQTMVWEGWVVLLLSVLLCLHICQSGPSVFVRATVGENLRVRRLLVRMVELVNVVLALSHNHITINQTIEQHHWEPPEDQLNRVLNRVREDKKKPPPDWWRGGGTAWQGLS